MKFEMQLWEINSRLYNDGIVRASIRKYVQDNKELTDEIKSKVAAEINKRPQVIYLNLLTYIRQGQCWPV